jgi:hypothetical protein
MSGRCEIEDTETEEKIMAPMKGYYDPALSKTDPLDTVHVKLPLSVRSAIKIFAANKRWHPAVAIREILSSWEKDTRGSEDRVVKKGKG